MDLVVRTRSLGTGAEGVPDQYADGKAAKVWKVCIGDAKQRTQGYKDFLVNMLRKKGCKRILDVACGTGIDSIMLLEEGFDVVSVDASDKMLKYALKERWNRRKEATFDNWIIEEANWITLPQDIPHLIGGGFDAVICLGNSFAHIPDNYGDKREQKEILKNFEQCIKPGGCLLIDHRNYDYILQHGNAPVQCIYYNGEHIQNITVSVMYVAGKPRMVILDYHVAMDDNESKTDTAEFRLSYYPHLLDEFNDMLDEVVPYETHTIYGDFKPLDEMKNPGFFIHVLEKKM
ncbi:hypothetical protein PV327_007165 [Microctonus hyperodae]|uniref:Glycine N-methyltransferase n=1 Tax=Microctonus hyperodae TaxID=165561 RepID=A0AA39F5W3_MICHY|nr:hypothetical protein PV327_007165 [Microctonus hyperodae]